MNSIINYNPDVLDALANLSNDEVFTPPKLVNQILDTLPQELWSDKTATFFDPATKSGVFLREIAKRLIKGLEQEFPNLQERLNHIYTKQLFGIAITELTSLLSRRSLYCSKHANGKYSISTTFDTSEGNIVFNRTEHEWKNGKCILCGANKDEYDRDESLETHAYEFIHKSPEQILNLFNNINMKFDVIIGNPPYQLDTGGSGRQAKPIYQDFVTQAKKLSPRFLSMIIPSRWFAGGMGLNDFRNDMLKDRRLTRIYDYVDAKDCFPGVDIAGGVCYFLWERDKKSNCEVTTYNMGKEYKATRQLDQFDTFIRYPVAANILEKIYKKEFRSMKLIISSTRPFGLKTSDRPDKEGDLTMYSSGGNGPLKKERVSSGIDMIEKWKVMTSKASHDHGGQPDKDGTRRVLSKLKILQPKEVCTESYIILGSFESKIEALNCKNYARSRFFRFLVSLLSFSQDITRERFTHVPIQDFTQEWTDEKLYKKYNLTQEEIDFVESMIRPMK